MSGKKLHPSQWGGDFPDERALGMLPGWQHSLAPAGTVQPPALPGRLALVTYQLNTLVAEARAIAARLAPTGCRVDITVLPYPEFATGSWRDDADLMLCGEVLADDLDYQCYQWLAGSGNFHPWLEDALRLRLEQGMAQLAAETERDARWRGYETMARMLVEEHALIPLNHHTLQLEAAEAVRGVTLTQCGWMDFARLWLMPGAR